MSEETGNLPVKRDSLQAERNEQPPDRQGLVELLSKALELETARVAVATREADVAAESLKVADADGERQFRFHSNRFEKEHSHRTERWRARNKRQWVLICAAIGLPVATLAVLFFGNPNQQQQALQVVGHVLSFGAGAGLGYFLGALRSGRAD